MSDTVDTVNEFKKVYGKRFSDTAGDRECALEDGMNNDELWNDYDERPSDAADELDYKDVVTTRLLDAIDEYLEFSTTRDLVRLIAGAL